MYLSRIQLTDAIAQESQLGKLLQRNSYGMHSLLWDLFETGERFLFREENRRDQLNVEKNRPLYFVLSHQQPKNDSPLFRVESKILEPSLKIGDKLGFKLRANPVVARRAEGEKKSKKHDVVMNAQKHWLIEACRVRGCSTVGKKSELKKSLLQHADYHGISGSKKLQAQLESVISEATARWIHERGDKLGFTVDAIEATGYRWNALPEKGRDAGFSSLDYEGVLTVAQPTTLLSAIKAGVGPAKAFGCGLMLIRRL